MLTWYALTYLLLFALSALGGIVVWRRWKTGARRAIFLKAFLVLALGGASLIFLYATLVSVSFQHDMNIMKPADVY